MPDSQMHGTDAGATASPLRWGEGLARALVAHSGDIILILSAEHVCLFASAAVWGRLGYTPEAVLGQNVIPLHHPEDLPRAAEMLAAAALHPGQPARCTVRIQHRDGSWRWMAVTATNGLADPEVRGIVCNLHDVSEEVEANLAMAEALQAQRIAREGGERLAAAKSDFLRLMGHEFKTPLTAIAGFAELMELDPSDGQGARESLAIIRSEVARMSRMIDDLLTADRLEASQVILQREPVDLNALVRQTVERMRGLDVQRQFELDLAPNLPLISADPDRLVQVIVNLVGNAVKFSPNGDPVRVVTEASAGSVCLQVSDRGLGISPRKLPALFTRYEREGRMETRGISGAGLGLSIVREIAELHGGEAWAESVEGEGSTFSVRLVVEGERGRGG